MMNNLQNKLSNFEAVPPGGVWDKIAEALDAEPVFPQRLYDYQEAPKANVWDKIKASLDDSVPAKLVPFTTRYRRPLRYIAAASVMAVILVSATLLIRRTEADSVPTAEEKTIPVEETIVKNHGTTPTINANNQRETVAAQPKSESSVYEPVTKQKKILSFIRPQNIFSAIVLRGKFVPKGVDKKELFSFSALNDYMVYSDGDGNAMKVPKKLFSLVNCPDGDGSCQERIHQLQQKLSSTALTADFTGILDMLRQLQ